MFSHSANASTLSSASAVFRVAMDDESRSMATRGSTTTLSTVEEDAALASGLEELVEELAVGMSSVGGVGEGDEELRAARGGGCGARRLVRRLHLLA